MIDLSIAMLVLAFTTFFAAGLVKGVTGMGLPTVAMGVLGAAISPLAAASLLIVPSLVTNVWQLFAGPHFGSLLRRLWPMMSAVFVGALLGSRWISRGDTGVTTTMLGVLLIIYSAYTLFAGQLSVPGRAETWLSPLVGAITGALGEQTARAIVLAIAAGDVPAVSIRF